MLLIYEDYDIKGYHKKRTYQANGWMSAVEYYESYDAVGSPQYSNLKVKESITTTTDVNGIPIRRDKVIEWYSGDQVEAVKTMVKYYTPMEGIELNEIAFGYVFKLATGYLISQIGLVDAKLILNGMATESGLYRMGSFQPLLNAIANNADPLMTPTIKGTLAYILDVHYA